jgi:hypothetical protein
MNAPTYTTQRQVRRAFWQAHPNLPRRRVRAGDRLVYLADTQGAWADFLAELQRGGDIPPDLAQTASLER